MRITEGQLRRIIRQEVASLNEAMEPGWVINIHPSKAEIAQRGGSSIGYFNASHFTAQEKAELQSAIASIGGKMIFAKGQGIGGVGSVGIRGITFPTEQEAVDAAEEVISMVSPPLAARLRPGRPRPAPRQWGG